MAQRSGHVERGAFSPGRSLASPAMSDEAFERDLSALRVALDRGPHPGDIETVLPVIVPRALVRTGHWPGPHVDLGHPDLGLTWTILHDDQVMTYVNAERVDLWERERVDWRFRAQANLIAATRTELWAHERRDASGNIIFVAMMQHDGMGSSRALLVDLIERELGEGVRIGVPDRSCAIVFPASVTRLDDLCGELLRRSDLRVVDAEAAG